MPLDMVQQLTYDSGIAAVVSLYGDGRWALEIPDAAGELHAYDVTALAGPRWAVLLTRLDTGDAHRLEGLATPGRFGCSCKDRQYRVPGRKRACKHMAAGPGLKAFADRLPPNTGATTMSTDTPATPATPVPDAGAALDALLAALAAPFDPSLVKFRPGAISGSRALAMPYVDARAIQDRLDDVLGPLHWQDEYEFLPDDGCVLCRLRLRLAGEWITKMDVGGPSEQPDEGDRRKAAVSDALKRAAVKFGIGRYLYRLPQTWVDYDPQRKQLRSLPRLPDPSAPVQKSVPRRTAPAAPAAEADPVTGGQLLDWLTRAEAAAVAAGLPPEALSAAVVGAVARARLSAGPLRDWSGPAITFAVRLARELYARCRDGAPVTAEEAAVFDSAARSRGLGPVELGTAAGAADPQRLTVRDWLVGLHLARGAQPGQALAKKAS